MKDLIKKLMKKEMNIWAACVVILLGVIFLWMAADYHETTSATAVGTVNVSGYLNVRKGPGKKYACLKSGGTKVTLANSAQVTILAKNKKWYRIRFKYNSKKLEGYVRSRYLSVLSGNVCTQVTGVVSPSAVVVRTKAGKNTKVLKDGLTTVKLLKKTKIRVQKEAVASGMKWYQVSFTYGKKVREGYIRADRVSIDYSTAIPGLIRTSGTVFLRKEAGKVTTVKVNNSPITMINGSQVLLVKEKTVNGVKYVKLEVTINGKTYRGYVAANLVRFQQVELEKPEATPTPTPEPEPSPEEKPEATPEPTPEPEETQEPEASKKPLTTAQFKKQLKKEGFPADYITELMALHETYPNWEFKAYKTGLDWSAAVAAESKVGLNLLSNGKSPDWKSLEQGAYDWMKDEYIPYDGSTWVTASSKAVQYYMDPRNFLDSKSIFQFENLEYQSNTQDQDGVENVLKNTPMHMSSYSYTGDDGASCDITYSQTFMKAAEDSGVSPYHLASRAKQEVVTGSESMSASVSGTVVGYEGIYNFYNIGAYHSTQPGGAIANGLSWASKGNTYNRPWTSPYRSIVGGAQYIGSNYINAGQSTLYLQKFNVTSYRTYDHQYMANIEAPSSEAYKTAEAYGSSKENMDIIFTIPIYNNMPQSPCPVPSGGANPNNYLKTLSVKGYDLDVSFRKGDDGSKLYTLTVENDVKSITIKATGISSLAKVSGTGQKKLKIGKKKYTIKVKAQSGAVRKYKLQVTRLKKSQE